MCWMAADGIQMPTDKLEVLTATHEEELCAERLVFMQTVQFQIRSPGRRKRLGSTEDEP